MSLQYMIDSSVWIRYLRYKNYDKADLINELIEKDQVFINGIIQTELLKGAKTEKKYNALKNSLSGLSFLEINQELLDRISEAAFLLRHKGISVPLSDLIIAIQCVHNQLVLIEEDKHFLLIKKHFDLKLYEGSLM